MTSSEQDATREVTLTLCERCIAGEGGECHTPGCALWMNRAPDVPIQQAREDAPFRERDAARAEERAMVAPFADHARTAHAAAQTTFGDACRWCGHKHDPEDGRCDVHAHVGFGACPCPGEGLAVAYDKVNAALYVAEQDCAELRGRLEVAPEPEWEYRVIYPDGSATYPETRDLAVTWAARGGGRVERCIARRARARGEWEALPDAD